MHHPLSARPLPDLRLPAPEKALQACVVVPVKDEEGLLPLLLEALARQVDPSGEPLPPAAYEIVLLLNNCTDGTAAVAAAWQVRFPALRLRVAEVMLPPKEAHVGRARQILFDVAYSRFLTLRRPRGLILTTDADTQPAPDWIAQAQAEVAAGVDGVGGRNLLRPEERALLPPGVQRHFLLDIGYRRALEEMRSLFAPEPHDPFPRHHQHFGGGMALTAGAYARAGGMPLARSSEDVALYRAVLASGGRFRHSYRMRTYTSARFLGRASGGLADALCWWDQQTLCEAVVEVESAAEVEKRLRRLGQWRQQHPGAPLPWELVEVPDYPPGPCTEPLTRVLAKLRVRNRELARLSLAERLAQPLCTELAKN